MHFLNRVMLNSTPNKIIAQERTNITNKKLVLSLDDCIVAVMLATEALLCLYQILDTY